MTRTADLKVNGFADGVTNTDIAKLIVDHFAAQNIKVLAIQQCPNKTARVTFEDRTACEVIQLRGELMVGDVKVPVLPPPPPPPNWVNVVVYNYPFDAPNEYINDALDSYGNIQSIRFQSWTNLPEVATGTRLVRMNLKSSIPRFVMVHTYRCKVWYRGQPTICDICREGTHIAYNCPYKGKCLGCKGVGHFSRNCPNVCYKCKGDHATDSCPLRRRWERVNRDVDDLEPVSSEMGPNTVVDDVPLSVLNPPIAAPESDSAPGSQPLLSSEDSIPPTPLDERLNQLDELPSQPATLPSQPDDHRDESDPPQSQSVLADLSGIVNEVCEATIEVLESSYDDTASSGRPIRPLSRESSMVELSNVRKRGAPRASSKERDRKSSRIPTRHIPASVSSAVFLARSNSSLSS